MAAKYELQDLPKFGDDKNKDPFEFIYQFDNFLRYINLNITNQQKLKMLFSYLAHACTRKPEAMLKLTLVQHQQMKKVLRYKEQLLNGTKLKKTLQKRFHPLGRTTEQLEFKWNNLKWSPLLESIEDCTKHK